MAIFGPTLCLQKLSHAFLRLSLDSFSFFIARAVESMQVYSEYPGVKLSPNDDIEVSKKENHNYIAN